MKKILIALLLHIPFSLFSQDFEFLDDSVSATTEGSAAFTAVHNKVINLSDRTYRFTWKLLNPDDILPSWSFNGFCDNSVCYTMMAPNEWYAGNPVESSDLAPSEESEFKLQLNIPPDAENGTCILKFEVSTEFQTDTAYFIATKASTTGIAIVPVDDARICLYPNPSATGKISLFTSKELKTKEIHLINMMGRKEAVIPASGTEIQVIDIQHLSNGIYFLDIIDHSGNKLSTRKFTKQ